MLFSKATLMVLSIAASANGQVNLGTASAYGVFGGTTVTSTGLTVVNARVGLSPGVSITGFPLGISDGQDISNAVATQAKADIQAAYNAAAGLATTQALTGTDLGGQVLLPGVYTFASSGGLTGILTLDGGGDANALFVFQFGSTLVTASASSVVLINGAQACNVFWQVGSSATFGTGTDFVGNVLAFTSITVTTGVSLSRGGFYALGGAVTLDTNLIDPLGACGAPAAIIIAVPPVTVSVPTDIIPTLPVTVVVPTSIIPTLPITVVVPTSIFSTTTTTQTPPVVTSTTTSTVTNPASTTTITLTVPVTVTQSVQVSTITVTSTTTKYSTKPWTKTASATKCPTKASSTKSSKTSTKAQNEKRAKASTKTKTVTTTCAKYTKTHQATTTVKATKAHTSTVWHTKSATTTSTVTYQPTCTNAPKAKRDYERMFG
jgi:hypothetical protein